MQDNHTQINLNPWIISETCRPQTEHLPFSHIACDLGNITIVTAGILSAYHVPGIFPQLSQLNSINTHSHPMRRVMIIFIVKGGELHTQDLLTLSPSSVKGLRLEWNRDTQTLSSVNCLIDITVWLKSLSCPSA